METENPSAKESQSKTKIIIGCGCLLFLGLGLVLILSTGLVGLILWGEEPEPLPFIYPVE